MYSLIQYIDGCVVDDAVTKLINQKTQAMVNAALASQPGMASAGDNIINDHDC